MTRQIHSYIRAAIATTEAIITLWWTDLRLAAKNANAAVQGLASVSLHGERGAPISSTTRDQPATAQISPHNSPLGLYTEVLKMQQILEKLARRHDHVQEPAKQLATRLAQLDHA